MSILLSLLMNPTVLGILAAVIGFFGYGKYKERVGAKKEQAKQAAAEAKARDIRDQVDNDLGTLTPAQQREELKKWAKR